MSSHAFLHRAALLCLALAIALSCACRAHGVAAGHEPLPHDSPGARGFIRVATHNIQSGTIYDLQGEKLGTDVERIAAVLRDIDADFIGLQEVAGAAQAAELARLLGMNHHYRDATPPLARRVVGVAILTPHPILEARHHALPGPSGPAHTLAEVLSEVDGQRLRVYACHLSFNNQPTKPLQVMAIVDILSRAEGPRVLVGDFNDMDTRPNSYSGLGFINLFTGSGHGTILPSAPRLFDVHRKAAIWSQVRNDPPFYSLRTDWDPPAQEANSISGWLPRVRIDHIFASPEFHLGADGVAAWVVDTREVTARLFPGQQPTIASDHRPVVADLLLPRPVARLFLNPQEGPTLVAGGESRAFHAGGVDDLGNPVSLMRTDRHAPLSEPAQTGRIIDGVAWSFEGDCGTIESIDPLEGYDALVRAHRPSGSKVRFHALKPGDGALVARIDGVEARLPVRVVAPTTLEEASTP